MYRKQTVHDVAFTGGAGPRPAPRRRGHPRVPRRTAHRGIFGALRQEHHIERGPGRHGVSNAFYLYLRDPDGHRVEIYTSDYYTGDPDHETYRWNVHDDRRRDFWGSAVIESWYKEPARSRASTARRSGHRHGARRVRRHVGSGRPGLSTRLPGAAVVRVSRRS